MKFIYSAIAAFRNFTTTTRIFARSGYKSKRKTRKTGTKDLITRLNWTDEQLKVLTAVSQGQSIFITGSAGTGKTVLVNHIIDLLKEIHRPWHVFVTASTGVAACALNGQTLHSFAGVGIGQANGEALLSKVLSNNRALWRWGKVKALVIDEISMIDGELFEKLEYIARETRHIDKVWGGIQLVVSGDFLQLPPIFDKLKSSRKLFAFEADCWNSSFDLQVELTKIFRQSDSQLIKLLQGIRRGEIVPGDLRLLHQCFSFAEPGPSVLQLFPRNQDVKRVNKERLESLNEKTIVYRAVDSGKQPWKAQLKLGMAPDALEICEGARVMLIKNIDVKRKLVNGAIGTVMGFTQLKGTNVSDLAYEDLLPTVKFDSGVKMEVESEEWTVMEGEDVKAKRKQIPLILAWALSVHKCQGMTLDSLHTNLSRAFGCGMVYVALSRVRRLEGLHLSGFSPSKIKADPKVLKFYQRFDGEQDNGDTDDGAIKPKNSITDSLDGTDTTTSGVAYYLHRGGWYC